MAADGTEALDGALLDLALSPVKARANATGAHAAAEHWGLGPPSEADRLEYTPDLPEGPPGEPACRLAARPWRVEVVVHQRGRSPRSGADVRVTLLWWVDPARPRTAVFGNPASWAPGPVPWAAAVQAMLNAGDGASAALSGGWHYVGTTNATRRRSPTGQTLDPLNPGIVSFELNLAGLRRDTVVLLVAVVRAGADLALASQPLRELTLGHPGVAARAVRIA